MDRPEALTRARVQGRRFTLSLSLRAGIREALIAYLCVLPALLLLAVFKGYPMVRAFGYAFTSWSGTGEARFVGLENFRAMFQDPAITGSFINAAKLFASLPLWVFVPLILAVLIYQELPGWRFFRAAYFFPSVLAPVVVGSIFTVLLNVNGPLNQVLERLGLGFLALDWLGGQQLALATVTGVVLWSSFGFGVIIYLAGLATVPTDYYDAAKVDGASWLQTFWHVTVPMMRGIIEFWTVLSSVTLLTSMFAYLIVMTGGGPGYATMLPELRIYQEATLFQHPGFASAMGLILFVFVFIVTLLQIRLMTRGGEEA